MPQCSYGITRNLVAYESRHGHARTDTHTHTLFSFLLFFFLLCFLLLSLPFLLSTFRKILFFFLLFFFSLSLPFLLSTFLEISLSFSLSLSPSPSFLSLFDFLGRFSFMVLEPSTIRLHLFRFLVGPLGRCESFISFIRLLRRGRPRRRVVALGSRLEGSLSLCLPSAEFEKEGGSSSSHEAPLIKGD